MDWDTIVVVHTDERWTVICIRKTEMVTVDKLSDVEALGQVAAALMRPSRLSFDNVGDPT